MKGNWDLLSQLAFLRGGSFLPVFSRALLGPPPVKTRENKPPEQKTRPERTKKRGRLINKLTRAARLQGIGVEVDESFDVKEHLTNWQRTQFSRATAFSKRKKGGRTDKSAIGPKSLDPDYYSRLAHPHEIKKNIGISFEIDNGRTAQANDIQTEFRRMVQTGDLDDFVYHGG